MDVAKDITDIVSTGAISITIIIVAFYLIKTIRK